MQRRSLGGSVAETVRFKLCCGFAELADYGTSEPNSLILR